MLQIPNDLFYNEPEFVKYEDDKAVMSLIAAGLYHEYADYSIDDILIDSRVAELLDYAGSYGLSLEQAIEIRVNQVKTTMKAAQDKNNTKLEEYLTFLTRL